MRKLLLLIVPILALVALPSSNATAATATCHIAVFEGVAQRADCPDGTHIATYKYRDGATLEGGFNNSMPQTLYATGMNTAAVPACGSWQADVFAGDVLPVIDQSHMYALGDRLLAHLEGDAGACEVAATTTTTAPSTTTTTVAIAPTKLARTGKHTTTLEVGAGLLLIVGALFILSSLAVDRR